jgi:hypothetical protein
MKSVTLLVVAGAAIMASARKCRDIKVSVCISSENMVLNLKPPTTEVDVTNFYLNLARQGTNFPGSITTAVSAHAILMAKTKKGGH